MVLPSHTSAYLWYWIVVAHDLNKIFFVMNIPCVHFGVEHILFWVETTPPVMFVRGFVPGDIYSGIYRNREKSTHVHTIQRSGLQNKKPGKVRVGFPIFRTCI